VGAPIFLLLTDAVFVLRVCLRRTVCSASAVVLSCLFAALAGCSTSEGVSSYLVDPGHYSAYHCKDFAARLAVLQARQKELSDLMEQASIGPGGTVIGGFAYRPDYEDAIGEERVLRRTAAEKKCDLPPPATPMTAAPAPAVYTGQAPPQPPQAAPAAIPVYQSDQTIR
jgi:hypothetical protein